MCGDKAVLLSVVIRMQELDPCRKLTFLKPEGTRRLGKPKLKWLESVEEDVKNGCVRKLYVICLLTGIWLPPGGSNTVHIYAQTVHRTTQSTQTIHRTTQFTNEEECRPCPVFASYTLAFALQLREKHGKPSFRVAEECQLAR